ncbi:amino acid ABC transporter permease [Ramlibacter sp.]|uniref:amino acid ABC transporter permease n=1 Tax=Ramlibacter sp. TaxID=1917967 RepID=UPI002630D761|nr:amino acid ABC transporter permease [Ramlibacter sp.]MDB5956081.1 transporter permease [Ramlibacter sp.]
MNASDYWQITQAALATVTLSLASIGMGMPLGLAMALVSWGRVPLLTPLVRGYVSVIRSCPTVTLTLLVFFGSSQAGLNLDAMVAAIVALTLSTAAFNCEIWRSHLNEFPRDQYDAALAFGMRPAQRSLRIVLPQVVRHSIPALVSEMTLQIKATPAVAVIGIVEITRAALRVGSATYQPLPPFLYALALYSVVVFAFVQLQRMAERRIARSPA